jgi:molecular chaperone DnaJ
MRLHDAYRVLGVPPAAEPAEIRAAFRRLVQERHPDTGASTGTEASVREVIEAYRLLADLPRRSGGDHDRSPPPTDGGRRIPVRHVAPRPSRPVGGVCPACGGAGRHLAVASCPACAGTGELTALGMGGARRLVCRACAGRGRRRIVSPCDRCDGSGAVGA